jgi:ABC-type uncharacterized transport system permease subunit
MQRWRAVLQVVGREMTPYVRQHLAGVLALVVLGAVMNALAPLALKWIVDGLARQGHVPLSAGILVGLYVSARSQTEGVARVF